MNIKFATPEDAEILVEYLETLSNEDCETITSFRSLPSIEEEASWLRKNDGNSGIVFIAVSEDQKVMGMIHAEVPSKSEFSHTCEFGLSVLKDLRQRGIGSKLLTCLLEWAEKKGLEIVELNVFSNNIAAIKMYEKFGFEIDGERKRAVKKKGNYYKLIHMSKSLIVENAE